MAKYLSSALSVIRQTLRDEFVPGSTQEWKDDELKIHIQKYLQEISECKPYKVVEVLTTTAYSKVLDISSIEDLIRIEKVEYPTGKTPRAFRNVNEIDAETIEMDITSTPDAGGSGNLTGIVTFTSGSATITGSGTAFTSELKAGYHIKKSGGTRWYRIYSVGSDTELTLAEPSRDSGADTEDATQYCYEAVYVFCHKLHQLTESVSTLNPQLKRLLILGVTAEAALARARKLMNKVNVGGSKVATDMHNWGATRLGLYREGLDIITEPQVYVEYPSG